MSGDSQLRVAVCSCLLQSHLISEVALLCLQALQILSQLLIGLNGIQLRSDQTVVVQYASAAAAIAKQIDIGADSGAVERSVDSRTILGGGGLSCCHKCQQTQRRD